MTITLSSLNSGVPNTQPLLLSGTNIKTINGTSVLGSGDLAVLQPNVTMSGALKRTLETRSTATISSGSLALDLVNGCVAVSLNANITSISLSNNVASPTIVQSITLEFTADGTARTITWPAGDGTTTLLVKWPGGTAPTMTSTNGKRDVIFLKSVSQFLWDGFVVGQNI